MAALNFPVNPAVDDTFIANNVIYTWTGVYWEANATNGFDARYVEVAGDTMTGDLNLPNLNATGDIQSTSQNGGQLAGFRNQIINGDFRVWQRGEATQGVNNDSYLGVDRFYINRSSLTGQSPTKSTTAPKGFSYSCTMPTATQGVHTSVEIEEGLAGCFSIGSTWTWSVWSDQDITGETHFARFRQAVGLTADSVDLATLPAFASTGETSNGFTRYSTTFVVTGAPVASSVCVNLYVGGGANRSYTGWQLEPGPVATPFEHRPVGLELSLCQRYYWTVEHIGRENLGIFILANANYSNYWQQFPVEMRVNPSIGFELGYTDGGWVGAVFQAQVGVYGGPSTLGTPVSVNKDYMSGTARFGTLEFSITADAEL